MKTQNRAVYVLFMNNDISSEEESYAIYSLVCDDNGFNVYERNPLTSKNKDKIESIVYTDIQQLSIDCLFDINHISPLIKHIYDKDPTGDFFDNDSSIILSIKTSDRTYMYAIKGVRKVVPTLVDIAKSNNIELIENINGYINDICTLSNVDLYNKYIQPLINYPTHIKEY